MDATRAACHRQMGRMGRMGDGLAQRIFSVSWLTVAALGVAELSRLVSDAPHGRIRHATLEPRPRGPAAVTAIETRWA